ncbi:MAG: isoaspartyl peptidase/L-asparaginase family protein [Acidimicrobiales bacterium]
MVRLERAVTADLGRLLLPAIIVHGGAGSFELIRSRDDADQLGRSLAAALAAGWAVLSAGGTALHAAVEAVAEMEDSALFNAGRGAVPTSAGTFELDAGVMDGTTGAVGAVCAATWPANPVRVALKLAEVGGAPDGPLLLAGAGADGFAKGSGCKQMARSTLPRGGGEPGHRARGPGSETGTVGAVAVDAGGRLAAATSTGGRSGQMPGRVGDSPIPGAGVWANSATAAVSGTGAGEAFIVAGFGHRVDWEMSHGQDVATALSRALGAVARLGGDGGGIALAGDGSFAASFNSRAMARGWRDGSGTVTRVLPAPLGA